MKEIEGIILKLGTEDLNGHVFSEDCKIDYPDKIPITIGYNFDKPGNVVGNAKVIRNDDTLSIQGEIMDNTIDTLIEKEIYTNLGFYANKVKKKGNNVTEIFIQSVALLTEKESALPYCKIINKGE